MRIRPSISFQGLFILLIAGALIPLLVLTGLLVFRRQRAYLLTEAQRNLTGFVQAEVKQHAGEPDLTALAEGLVEDLSVLGGNVFVQNASGELASPSLGVKPWLGALEHEAARVTGRGQIRTIGSGAAFRVVYLASVVDPNGAPLASVEASLPSTAITAQLGALRREITLIVAAAAGLSMLFAMFLASLITRPIHRMRAAIERVLDGDLAARAPVSGVVELRQMAIAFNLMLDWMYEDVRDQVRRTEGA
jgi:methyl-accepting chemotaxis protein